MTESIPELPNALIAKPSAMSLFIAMRYNGVQLATGTAFVVASKKGPILITNRHNVTGRDNRTGKHLHSGGGIPNEIVIRHNKKDVLGDAIERAEPLIGQDGAPLWYEHPILKERADVVALPLNNLDGVALHPYDLLKWKSEIDVGPGDIISVIGFPFGQTAGGSLAIWATGFIASELEVGYEGLPQFLIDCRSRQGQSGAPVVAYRPKNSVYNKSGKLFHFDGNVYRFLGIYCGRINPESDIGIVWSVEIINQLVESL